MSIDQHDTKKMHCRMLGHEVTFAYCRQTVAAQPCRRILDCWFQSFNVEQFVRSHFKPEQMAAILDPPKPKMTSILELIERAKKAHQT